ncbi:MAG TPA: hypothetical protein V6D03_07225 [Candidatus Caenarcaniphilales bacterium]
MKIISRVASWYDIVAVAALAVNVHHGLGKNSVSFALSYAGVLAVLIVEYLRAGRHITAADPTGCSGLCYPGSA